MPAIANLPTIARSESASGSNNPTFGVIHRAERCFITNSVPHTHKPNHWVNVNRREKADLLSPTSHCNPVNKKPSL